MNLVLSTAEKTNFHVFSHCGVAEIKIKTSSSTGVKIQSTCHQLFYAHLSRRQPESVLRNSDSGCTGAVLIKFKLSSLFMHCNDAVEL